MTIISLISFFAKFIMIYEYYTYIKGFKLKYRKVYNVYRCTPYCNALTYKENFKLFLKLCRKTWLYAGFIAFEVNTFFSVNLDYWLM